MRFSNAVSDFRTPASRNPWILGCVLGFAALWIATLVGTSDISNWFLENTLVILGLIGLWIGYRRLQLSDLSYVLIFVYLGLHVYGSMHTYAENPFGA